MPGTRWSGGSPWTAALLDDGRLIERLDVVGRPNVESETVVWAKGLQRSDTVRTTACAAVTSDDFNRAYIPLKTATGELIMNVPLPFANPVVDQAFDRSGMVWESYPGRSNRIVGHHALSCSAPVVIALQGAPARIRSGQLDRQEQQLRLRAEKNQQSVPDVKQWPTTFPWYLA